MCGSLTVTVGKLQNVFQHKATYQNGLVSRRNQRVKHGETMFRELFNATNAPARSSILPVVKKDPTTGSVHDSGC